mmetsp:Transcript_17294/g.48627  ORF Transcript_17294/g.48627 Transcript_17294/m.48627 type:complete len:364 (+) Transcript_17294:87-1178(+)
MGYSLKCSSCRVFFDAGFFSSNQLSKRADRRCYSCVDQNLWGTEEEFECSACYNYLDGGSFSYNQLQKGNDRRCRDCVENGNWGSSSTDSDQEEDEEEEEELDCFVCGESLKAKHFTEYQLDEGYYRECRRCRGDSSAPCTTDEEDTMPPLTSTTDEDDGEYTDVEEGDDGLLECSACQDRIEVENFSYNQLRKGSDRRCPLCVTQNQWECPRGNVVDVEEGDDGLLECSACQDRIEVENFSYNQLRKGSDRRCPLCVTQNQWECPRGNVVEVRAHDEAVEKRDEGKRGVESEVATSSAVKGKPDQSGGERMCSVCLERKVSHILVPCGHYGFCGICAQYLAQLGSCPLCRKIIHAAYQVFTV